MEGTPKKQRRGFAAMSREKQRALAIKGGKTAQARGTAHRWTKEQAQQHAPVGGVARHQTKATSEAPLPVAASPSTSAHEGVRLMGQLAVALRQAEHEGTADYEAGVRTLQGAAEDWAVYSLRTFRGDHLIAALAIATAISQFLALIDDTPDSEAER